MPRTRIALGTRVANVKEILVRNRCDVWSLSDSNGIRSHNHLVRERTLNHLAKLAGLAKWLSVLYGLSGCGFESRCCVLNIKKHWFPDAECSLRAKWLWVRIPLLCAKHQKTLVSWCFQEMWKWSNIRLKLNFQSKLSAHLCKEPVRCQSGLVQFSFCW